MPMLNLKYDTMQTYAAFIILEVMSLFVKRKLIEFDIFRQHQFTEVHIKVTNKALGNRMNSKMMCCQAKCILLCMYLPPRRSTLCQNVTIGNRTQSITL